MTVLAATVYYPHWRLIGSDRTDFNDVAMSVIGFLAMRDSMTVIAGSLSRGLQIQ